MKFPHWKPEIFLYLVVDQNPYTYPSGIPAQFSKVLKVDKLRGLYEPIVYPSDFWLLNNRFQPINATVTSLNLSLHFNTYMQYYYMMQLQFD